MRAWERKIGDPWCSQIFFGTGLTIPTSDGTTIPPWSGDNYASATVENFDEINSQVTQLLASGKIERVSPSDSPNLVVNPVGAANKKDHGVILKEKRFYLDCSRHVNSRLPHYKMQLPGYDDALSRLFPSAWLAKVDLSAAFLHVRIDPRYRRVLGFQWQGSFYQFTRMIFGLSTAPAIWQYAMDRVCDYLRSIGLNVSVYLDDFLLISDSRSSSDAQLALLYEELASLGLTVNKKKTLGPSQSIHYLGLEIDSVKMELRVPDYKRLQISEEIAAFRARFSSHQAAPLRAVLSLTGKLGHVARAVRASRPFLRRLWDLCRGLDFGHNLRNRFVSLPRDIWQDLEWWATLLSRWDGVSRWITDVDVISFSDASNYGFGFHYGVHMHSGAWPKLVRSRHINWKELRAIELSCAELGPLWRGRRVLFACDNQAAVAILNSVSSRNPAMAAIIRRIALLAALFGFDFRAIHIPGSENHVADFLSRATTSCEAADWPPLYSDLLDSSPSCLLSSSSLLTALSAISHTMLSACQSHESASREARTQHEEDLRSLRQKVPDMERLARSLRSPDPFGRDRPVLPSVPRCNGLRLLRDLDHQRCEFCDPRPVQDPLVEDRTRLQGHQARHCTHYCLSPRAEAPIPLEVVTPARQTYSSL